jgi:hypothetical protein
MRIQHLTENKNNLVLLESFGLEQDSYNTYWMREIHPVLLEVALSPEQIKQLFKSIETTASEQGSNRTMAGKAVDKAGEITDKVKDLWFNKLGGALQQSGPVKAFDAKYEEIKNKVAAENPKLAAALGKYKEFADANPNLQKFLLMVAASVAGAMGLAVAGGAAAGIAATGLGVGAGVAIVNIVDRLLKGEKASTAIGRGATAGIVAGLTAAGVKAATAAIDQLGQITKIKNSYYVEYNGQGAYVNAEDYRAWTQGMKSANEMTKGIDFMSNSQAYFDASAKGMAKSAEVAAEILAKASDPAYQEAAMAAAEIVIKPGAVESAVAAMRDAAKAVNPVISAVAGTAAGAAGEKSKKESYYLQTRPLSEGQVYLLLKKISQQQELTEGPVWDKVKSGAKNFAKREIDTAKGMMGMVGKGLSAVGKQITTNATYPKLLAAWKLEGSPTDSEELKKFLTNYGGITPEVINKVYTDMKLPVPGSEAAAAGIEFVKQMLTKMKTDEKVELVNYMTKELKVA